MNGLIEIALRKQIGTFTLDCQVSLPTQGVSAIYGPSGSGKTSLLKCIAGLERAEGLVQLGQSVWQNDMQFVPAHERGIGYVFQDGRLFPHLNVSANIAYGLKRTASQARQIDLNQIIEWLDLSPLLNRRVQNLSGGEKQRVAIARALAASPRLLLMDEPLSALDTQSKKTILPYLETLHQSLSIPVIYVSHAMSEVARLADNLVLMEKGKVTASGSLDEVLTSADQALHHSEEAGVVIPANIVERDEEWHLIKARLGNQHIWLKDQGEPLNQAVRLRLLARDISLSQERHADQSIVNALQGEIEAIFDGDHPAIKLVRVNIDSSKVLARVTAKSLAALNLTIGQPVWVQIKSVAVLD